MASIVEFKKVRYAYPLSDGAVIRDISFTLEKGKFYGLIGQNGSGKTTLCALIRGFAPGFYKGKLEGEILIDGKPVPDYGPGELSRRIGYVFQNPFNQISGIKNTVFEEIAFTLENFGVHPDEIERRVIETMELTAIGSLAEKNPFELSGGQQQRLALASVLVLKPDILVIDEPTSQLDPEGAESVFEIIRAMKKEGKTIILAEHRVDLIAEYADEVLAMHQGALLRKGPAAEVFRDEALPDYGVQVPLVTLLCHELIRRGMPLGRVPITEDAAVEILKKHIGMPCLSCP
jgi:energy-coupling factor transport system ATP-binding protein